MTKCVRSSENAKSIYVEIRLQVDALIWEAVFRAGILPPRPTVRQRDIKGEEDKLKDDA